MKILLFSLLLSCSLAAISASGSEGDFPDVSIEQLEKLIENKSVILVDVNGSKYYAKGHIPGAIDFRAHEEDLASVLGKEKDKLVVVYCGGPSCAAYETAAIAIRDLGFTDVRHLSAGISGWIGAGKPTDRTDQ